MLAKSSVGGVLAVMVLWPYYPAARGDTLSPVDVCRRLYYLQLIPKLFAQANFFYMLSIGHASWKQSIQWTLPGASVMYGNIKCGRRSTKLSGASVVAKSEKSDGRSSPVEYISGSCEGWSLFWNRSTSKCRPPSTHSVSLWIRMSTIPQWWQLFVVLRCILASRFLVGMRSWITINQTALSFRRLMSTIVVVPHR